MPEKLTRQGARSVTEVLDRIATVIERNASALGIPDEIAVDFARRADVLADTIELKAADNFPLKEGSEGQDKTASPDWGHPAKDETGTSLSPSNGGWDPNAIGDDTGGPYVSQPDESSYMAGHFAQNWFHQLRDKVESNSVPRLGQVDKFAAAGMAMDACLRDVVRVASCGKMADAEFQDHIAQLSELNRLIAETQTEITVSAGDLGRKASLSAEQKTVLAGFDGLIATLKAQSDHVASIRDILLQSRRHTNASDAEVKFASEVREVIADIWDVVRKQGSGFQQAASKLQYASQHSEDGVGVVGTALGRLFEMGASVVDGAKDRVARSFAGFSDKTASEDSNLLRRLLAEEGMSTRLAGDDEDDDTEDEDESDDESDDDTEDESDDDSVEGKTAGFNLFE